MDSKICFEMSVVVVEAIRGRCASFMIVTATVSEICGGQTNVPRWKRQTCGQFRLFASCNIICVQTTLCEKSSSITH